MKTDDPRLGMASRVSGENGHPVGVALEGEAAELLEELSEVSTLPAAPSRERRLGRRPLSGRYLGTTQAAGRRAIYELDLRVDVDRLRANSAVMSRVSGDVYQVYEFRWFGRGFRWRVFRESWIVVQPQVNWLRDSVEVTGTVTYWRGAHPSTQMKFEVERSLFGRADARLTLAELGRPGVSYTCTKQSSAFRDVTLEIDVCDSVNAEPIVPKYDTHGHPTRPGDLPHQTLTIQRSYAKAGIDIYVNEAGHSIIDDSAATFASWTPAELHDAMEQHFSRIRGRWPDWHLWCLLAGTFESSGVGGIMFDAATAFGGAGEPPERQGCAVFRSHSWFNDLVQNPSTDVEQQAMRQYLYTYVHEIGHAFNLLHSWNKNRSDALSWMNYDWRYDSRNGPDEFWSNFRFVFDDEELIHLRHGDRAEVIMGGDPWSSGSHLDSPTSLMENHGHAFSELLGSAPVELLIRSKKYFYFMEPISVELRLRNTSDAPIDLDTRLHPEFGGVVVYIRRPDGRVLEFSPILCKLAESERKTLKAKEEAVHGEDRYSESVTLSYGTYGFYFNQPGEYHIRAMYQGDGSVLIPSNVHRLRVGVPLSRDEDVVAQDFFGYQAGMALSLGGSDSPALRDGMATLEDMADRFSATPVGAHICHTLGEHLARSFHRVDYDTKKLLLTRAADPEASLHMFDQALKKRRAKGEPETFTNLQYHQLGRTRATVMAAAGKKAEAKRELTTLGNDLKKRGVNAPVLDDLKAFAKAL